MALMAFGGKHFSLRGSHHTYFIQTHTNLGFHLVVLAALEGTCMATFSVPSEVSDGETSTHLFFFLSCEYR